MGFFVVSVLFAYFWSLGGVLVQTWRVTDVLSALLEIFFTIAFLSLPSYTTLKLDDKHSHEDLNVVESCLFWPRIDLTFHVISSDPKQPYLPPLKKDIYVFFKIYLAEPGRSCGTQDLQFSFRLLPFFFFFNHWWSPKKIAVYCPGHQWGCRSRNSYHVPSKEEGMMWKFSLVSGRKRPVSWEESVYFYLLNSDSCNRTCFLLCWGCSEAQN